MLKSITYVEEAVPQFKKKSILRLGVSVHTFNSRTQEAEEGGSLGV